MHGTQKIDGFIDCRRAFPGDQYRLARVLEVVAVKVPSHCGDKLRVPLWFGAGEIQFIENLPLHSGQIRIGSIARNSTTDYRQDEWQDKEKPDRGARTQRMISRNPMGTGCSWPMALLRLAHPSVAFVTDCYFPPPHFPSPHFPSFMQPRICFMCASRSLASITPSPFLSIFSNMTSWPCMNSSLVTLPSLSASMA